MIKKIKTLLNFLSKILKYAKKFKIIFSIFTIFPLFVLFPTLISVYSLNINNLSPPPKIESNDKTNFKNYKDWWDKAYKELAKPETTSWSKEKANQNKLAFHSIVKITLKKIFSNKYLDKDVPWRIATFQQKMSKNQELTNLFLQLMWSGIDVIALDWLGALSTLWEVAHPSHDPYRLMLLIWYSDWFKNLTRPEKIAFFENVDVNLTDAKKKILYQKWIKKVKNGEIPFNSIRKFILPKKGLSHVFPATPSDCVGQDSGNILHLEKVNLNKQCLGFSKKNVKNGFFNLSWWKNDKLKHGTHEVWPQEANIEPSTNFPWWFYSNHKNIFKDKEIKGKEKGYYFVTTFYVNELIKGLREQFVKSNKFFSDWKIDFTKLTGKAKKQLLNLIDWEGNLRSGIQENVLTHIEKRWGKLDFLNDGLLEKIKILGINQIINSFLKKDSFAKKQIDNDEIVSSDKIIKAINDLWTPWLQTLKKSNKPSLTLITVNKEQIPLSSLLNSKAQEASDLSLFDLIVLKKLQPLGLEKLKSQVQTQIDSQQKDKKKRDKKLIIGLSVGGGVLTLSSLGGFFYWFFQIKK